MMELWRSGNDMFRKVLTAQFYVFATGDVGGDSASSLIQRLKNEPRLWWVRLSGIEYDIRQDYANRSLIEMLRHFEATYLYPEYRHLRRNVRFLLPGLYLTAYGSERTVQVLLSIHESCVATLIFLLDPIPECDATALKSLAVLYDSEQAARYSDALIGLARDFKVSLTPHASLDSLFVAYLKIISTSTGLDLLASNQINLDSPDVHVAINLSLSNRYQFISVEGVEANVDDIRTYVAANRQALVDAAMAYRSYASTEFSYSASRHENEILRHFTDDASVRKHLTYSMNDQRVLAISAISAHPEIYPYDTNRPWYSSYIGMIELVIGQFEVLYLLHGELWRDLAPAGKKMVQLRRRAYAALIDFQNARVLNHPRGRKFISRLGDYLNINSYYEVSRSRLELAVGIAAEKQQAAERREGRANSIALMILAVLMAYKLPVDLAMLEVNAPTMLPRVLLQWLGIAVIFALIVILVRRRTSA
jgi:hypothetical protein